MASTEAVVAGYRDVAAFSAAVRGLRETGVAPRIYSNVPLEELEEGRSKVLLFALVGAIVGGSSAFLLAAWSAKAYPLITGGMPLIAGPPVGLVTYEGTALGAVLATVLGVLLEGRLAGGSPPPEQVSTLLGDGLHVLEVAAEGEAVVALLDDADRVFGLATDAADEPDDEAS
ncbi:MAG: quinol:electron acceptor oxidoreductase subunit ActD [Acidobacteriota bacterium]